MFAIFIIFPAALLALLDGAAPVSLSRRKQLRSSGIPVSAAIMRVDVIVTKHRSPPDANNLSSTSTSTTIRPVVRFATGTGEVITTSPIRSRADRYLVAGERVNLRYSPAKPMRCIVDQPRAGKYGMSSSVVGIVLINVMLIGFIVFAVKMYDGVSATMPTFLSPGGQ